MNPTIRQSLWLVIPCFFFLIASVCGWFGIMAGLVFGFLSTFSFLFFAGLYILRMRNHWGKGGRVAITYFALVIVCVGGFYACFGFQKNPCMNTFRARIKHEYAKHIPEIQTWAAATLKTARQENYSITKSNWPAWMQINGLPSPTVVVYNYEDGGGGPAYISIAWFNVGTCGFKVGDSSLQTQGEKIADGIYFFGGH
jgi:hypothetical protein